MGGITFQAVRPGRWLAVCRTHTGIKPRRPSPARGPCSTCGKEYALSATGLVRAHDKGWDRCVGSGRPPQAGGVTA